MKIIKINCMAKKVDGKWEASCPDFKLFALSKNLEKAQKNLEEKINAHFRKKEVKEKIEKEIDTYLEKSLHPEYKHHYKYLTFRNKIIDWDIINNTLYYDLCYDVGIAAEINGNFELLKMP